MMKRYLYSIGITLSLSYLLHYLDLLHIASTRHVDTLFLISLFVLLTSACIYVTRTNFFGLFMQGWKKVGSILLRKSSSMQEVDEMLRSDVVLNEWKKRLTVTLMIYTFGSGTALFAIAMVLSFNR